MTGLLLAASRPSARPARRPARSGWDLPLARARDDGEWARLPACSADDPGGVPTGHPAVRAHLRAQVSGRGYRGEDFVPDDPGVPRVPDAGGWLVAVDTASVNRSCEQLLGGFRVPTFSVWFGVPLPTTDRRLPECAVVLPYAQARTDARDARMRVVLRARLTEVLTPGGTMMLWPHELVAVSRAEAARLLALPSTVVSPIGDPTVRRPLGIDPDRLFYLQSRGIGYAGAVRLLLHEASVPGVAWADLGAGGPA